MDFALSPELAAYQEKLYKWGVEVARALAREAGREHALPKNVAEILDTSPVPLDRIDGDARPLPDFPDGTLMRESAIKEAQIYADPWLFESTNRGVAYQVVGKAGTPEQIAKWYTPYAQAGASATALGMTEPGTGSDSSGIATTARREGHSWVLNGSKMYCSLGAKSEYIVVIATIDRALKHKGIRAFVVEKDTPGLIITRANESKLGLRAWMTTALTLENCRIPLDHLLGWTGEGMDESVLVKSLGRALSSFNYSRPGAAMLAMSIAKAALDEATRMLEERREEFSPRVWAAVEMDLERMNDAHQRARRLCYQGIWLEQEGMPNKVEAAAGKAYGPPTAELIIRRCMQLLGAEGASETHLLEKWYRDIKIFDIFEGTGQIMRRLIAKSLMGPSAA